MKILEKDYMFVNPPKTPYLGIGVTTNGYNWALNNITKYTPTSMTQGDVRYILGCEELLVPSISPNEFNYEENESYDCILSKQDISILIMKLQEILHNMENYVITPEMDKKYESYLQYLINSDERKVNYERQKQEYPLSE